MLGLFSQPGNAQDLLSLPRLDDAIVLDGLSDEAAWQAIEPLPLVTYQPLYLGEQTEQTEIRVAYDDDYLYVAGKLYVKDAADVRGNSLYRDRYSGDDTFALVLDTFNDNENALWFFTNPAGTRFDMAVSNDAVFSGGDPFGGVINSSWNTFWDAATVQTDEGWFVEMRIPYSSLGFQDNNGDVVMGMIAYRFLSKKNERHIFPSISPEVGMGFAKPSVAQDVVLRGVSSKKPLYITPYVLSGYGETADLDATGTRYLTDDAFTREVGLDVKYNLTSNLTLDVTANTDFAQVEADDQQVNLTRFSLFFPEKRQFFQERAGIFEFKTGTFDRLFHSRQIGIQDGETVRLLGGTRLVGRLGNWDVGLIDMQTASTDAAPSENFGVLRLRRQVFNSLSYAGGMLTSRLGNDGSYNVSYGLDAIVRVVGDDFLTVQWAQSLEDEVLDSDDFDFIESGLMRIQMQRRRSEGWTYFGNLTRAGANYDPGIGFVTRRDYTLYAGELAYGMFPGEASPLRTLTPSIFGDLFFRNADNTLESAEFGADVSTDLKSGAEAGFEVQVLVEDLEEWLDLPEDKGVPAGRYTFTQANASYQMPNGQLFRTEGGVGGGSFYDGWRAFVDVESTWNASRHLELQGQYEGNIVRFPDRDDDFTVHILRLRTQLALNTKVSATVFFQYSSADDFVSTNVRFRYNFREGNDLWLVYNEGLNSDRDRNLIRLPRRDNRTFLLKYTYTFGA